MKTGTESAFPAAYAVDKQRQQTGGVPSRRMAGGGGGSGAGTPQEPGGDRRDEAGAGGPGQQGRDGARKQRPPALRIALWLLRKSIVPLLCAAALIAGLYAGYVVIGKGPEDDVWQWSTWKHMWDLIFSE